MKTSRWQLPDLGVGVGLRTKHYSHILTNKPKVDFFEIVSENYMESHGRPLHVLEQVAAHYPIIMHGVSLSIGTTDPLNLDYLKKLKTLADRVNARIVSDHFCWTGVAGRNVHDLLPLPTDERTIKHIVPRIKQVQDFLGRPFFLENPSTYMDFACSTMPEWEFISRVTEEADCGILLDLNNIYVSGRNSGFDGFEYINNIPAERVGYFHLAGHTDKGTHCIDTHSDHAIPEVWDLYQLAHARTGGRSTVYEWDENIPDFETLHQEALKAALYRNAASVPVVNPGVRPTEVPHA